MMDQRVAVLGLGKIGTILLQGLLKAGLSPDNACATVRHADRARALCGKLTLAVGTDNRAAARAADIVLIAVKPQNVGDLLEEIRADVTPAKLVVSVAASVPTGYIEGHLEKGVPVVRAMPNTPCQVGAGMTGICKGSHATEAHLESARKLFETVGRTVVVDEKHMDAVTGLSASGPAFVYIILESLAEDVDERGSWPPCCRRRRCSGRRRSPSRPAITPRCSRTPSPHRPAARSTASSSWKKASSA